MSGRTPHIVIIEGKDKGKVIPLTKGTIVIGRSKGDVLLQDPRVSRSHVAIHFDDKTGKVTFTDLKSLNGTLLNAEPKETGELKDGDRLQLGNTLFDCQIGIKEAEKTAPRSKVKAEKEEVTAPREVPVFEAPWKEPSEMLGVPAEESHPSRFNLFLPLKGAYRAVPPRVRIYSLATIALLGIGLYLFRQPAGPSSEVKESMLTSIRSLEAAGKIDEALLKAEEVRKKYPDMPALHLLLGDLHGQQGRIEQAKKEYRKALELDPKQAMAYVRLSRLLLSTGLTREAQEQNKIIDNLLKEKLSKRDGITLADKEFFIETANLYLDYRDLEVPPTKMVIIGQALQNVIAPESTSGAKLEAIGRILQGVPEDALTVLDKARKLDPQDQSIIQYMVFAKIKINDLVGANSLVEEWIQLFPQATQPLLIMAHWKYEAKDYASAMSYLQKIVQIATQNPGEPTYPEALNLLGRLFQQQNQTKEAEVAFKQSCELGFQASCNKTAEAPPSEEESNSGPRAYAPDLPPLGSIRSRFSSTIDRLF